LTQVTDVEKCCHNVGHSRHSCHVQFLHPQAPPPPPKEKKKEIIKVKDDMETDKRM